MSLQTDIESLLSEPKAKPLSVDEALAMEGLSEEDEAKLLYIRETFGGTITLVDTGDLDEEREALKADKAVEAPEAFGDASGDGGGMSGRRGSGKEDPNLSLWDDRGVTADAILPGQGLRNTDDPDFEIPNRDDAPDSD